MKIWTAITIALTPYLIVLILFISTMFAATETTLVPCYDKYSNEIIGVLCEDEVLTDPLMLTIEENANTIGILSMMWTLGFIFTYFQWWYKDDD